MRGFGFWAIPLVAVVAFALPGCSKLVKVTGRVTMNGQPLEGAAVNFHPEGQGKDAHGFTAADGTFSLSTVATDDGAEPGKYKVYINYRAGGEGYVPRAESDQTPGGGMREAFAANKQATRDRNRRHEKPTIPPEYSDVSKTKLEASVPPGGPLEFDIKTK
jgi:hypothetical protein